MGEDLNFIKGRILFEELTVIAYRSMLPLSPVKRDT
jgi:hypothetical protein